MTPIERRPDQRRPGRLLGAAAALLCLAAASSAWAGPGDEASAAMVDAEGNEVGTVELSQLQNGTLVVAKLTGLPEGAHGFHVHETGTCEPPFASAGGHFNPTSAKHGFGAEGGPHAGDMPNIHVPSSGELTIEVFTANPAAGATLLDTDATATVTHAGTATSESAPSVNPGARCAAGGTTAGTGGWTEGGPGREGRGQAG